MNSSGDFETSNEEHRIMTAFIPVISIMLVMAIIGKYGNGFIIFSTIKHKSLHGSCNILIACNALSDIGHQLGIYVLAYYVFSGINFTSQETCFYLQLIPNFFYHVGIFLTFWIGVDRLASVAMPIHYRFWNEKNTKWYLAFMIIVPICYSLVWVILAYEAVILEPENQVVCVISSFIPYSLNRAHSWNNIILSVCMVMTYATTWIFVRIRKDKFTQTRQVIKSLTVIMLIIIVSWPISTLLFNIIKQTAPKDHQQTYKLYVSILLNIGLCVNFFVYYTFSKIYRVAFQKDLSKILCLKNLFKPNVVNGVNVWQTNANSYKSM